MLGIILGALIVIASAAQWVACPIVSPNMCSGLAVSSIIFGFLGILIIGAGIALLFEEKGRKQRTAQQDAP